jgi:hypothetical protein
MGEFLRLASLAVLIASLGAGTAPAFAGEAEKEAEKDVPAPEKDAGEGAADQALQIKPADIWVLEFRFQKVGIIQPTEGIHRGETYWYMLYQIHNGTGKDREAFVAVTARSNKNKSYASIWLPDVETLLERRVGKPLWGKNEETKAVRERAGKEDPKADKSKYNYFPFSAGKTIDCIAIFNKLDPGATSITITVEGLSNDLQLIERENAPRQIESRVFVLDLERPGDEYAMNMDQVRLLKSGWMKKMTNLALPEGKSGGEKASDRGKAKEASGEE